MRVGVLTGGGDCPGLNAVIRAVVRRGVRDHGFDFVGFRDGWRGPLEGVTMELGIEQCRGILPRGGTILGSSRTNPFKIDNGVERIKDNLAKDGVDAMIAIGGEDTLGVATKLADPSRPVLDASGYSHRVLETDIWDSHNYEQDPSSFASEVGGLSVAPALALGPFALPLLLRPEPGKVMPLDFGVEAER